MNRQTANKKRLMTSFARAVRLVGVVAGMALAAGGAHAFCVVEDFEFYENGPLGGNAGGSGFTGAWTTNYVTTLCVTNTTNLSCGTTGYEVSSLGTGALTASFTTGYLSKRSLAATINGTAAGRTVWFSTLIRPTAGARVGWHFNPADYTRNIAVSGFLAVGTDLKFLTNTVLFASGKALTANTTHLILGSITLYDTGQSTVNYWIDPSNVTSANTLEAPDFSFAPVFNNVFGAKLANVGLEAYNDVNGMIDAVRISDGDGDPEKAFLDVTKKTPKALFGPIQFGSLAEVTNRFALINAIATNDWNSTNDNNYGSGGFLRPGVYPSGTHHVFVPDSDGVVGGGNDTFGDCTIDYDIRKASSSWNVGAFFLGAARTSKHWMLNINSGAQANEMRAYYNRAMDGTGGGSIQTTVTHPLDLSDWRHIRLDVRRVNAFTQVQVRVRMWNDPDDFSTLPLLDTNIVYDAAHSTPTDGEVGFSAYYQGSSSDIDNVAVYRYGGAPNGFIPKGTIIRLQ